MRREIPGLVGLGEGRGELDWGLGLGFTFTDLEANIGPVDAGSSRRRESGHFRGGLCLNASEETTGNGEEEVGYILYRTGREGGGELGCRG